MESINKSGLSLKRNFSWTFFGNIVFQFSLWGIVMILTKFGTAEMVGQYSLAIAVSTPIILLTGVNLRGFLVTDAKKEFDYEDYFGTRISTTFISILITLGVLIYAKYDSITFWVVFIVTLSKVVESFSDIIYGVQQQHEKMDYVAKSLIIRGLLSLLVVFFTLTITSNIVFTFIILTLLWLLLFLFYDLKMVRKFVEFKPRFNYKTIKKIIALSFPLGIVATLISYNVNIPRYFIKYYSGTNAIGHFASISYIMTAGSMFVTSVGQAVLPRLAKLYSNKNKKGFISLTLKMTLLGLLLGVIAILLVILIGDSLLVLLYNPEYRKLDNVFQLLTIGASIGFINSFLGIALTGARYFKTQATLAAVNTVVSTVSSFYFIREYSLVGAAYVVILMSIVQFAGTLVIFYFALKKFSLKESN